MKYIIDTDKLPCNNGQNCTSCPFWPIDDICEIKEQVKKLPKYEERHGEWIPCSERLPEEDGKYLVCWCGDWGVDICFAEYSKCGKYWYARYGSEYRGITAWMPLPEPYKREGETE